VDQTPKDDLEQQYRLKVTEESLESLKAQSIEAESVTNEAASYVDN